MSKAVKEVLSANAEYVRNFGEKGGLPVRPGKKIAILTCMDARMDPAKFAGLVEGDANVIRNAGGRASDDAIRSLVVSYKLLGTEEWFVVHHTGCGLATLTGEKMGDLLESSLETSELGDSGWSDCGKGPGTAEGRYVDWLAIRDPEQAVIDDVQRIRRSPMVPSRISIYGYIYDCSTGKLIEVPAATEAGKAS